MKFTLPMPVSLKIEEFTAGVFTIADSFARNCIFDQYDNKKLFATQRPGVNIHDDASVTTADVRGRGIYHWQKQNELYFVNDTKVYKGGYSVALAATLDSGIERVEFFEVGDYLVILDQENNKGYTINSSTPSTLTEITDVDFPPKQTPALTLARGGAVLNGILYVMDTNGTIWGSATEDPTTWSALNNVTAEIEADQGIALSLHHQHVVALGKSTIEFFYDAANATGSALAVRQDIDYHIGAVSHDGVVRIADELFFVGISKSGSLGVYSISAFALQKVSTADIDSMLSSALIVDQMSLFSSGFVFGNSISYIFTLAFVVSGDYVIAKSYAFNLTQRIWGIWDLIHPGYDSFPIVSWTSGKIVRSGEGLTSLGDVVSLADDLNPVDSILAQIYVITDYVLDGYISDTGFSGTDIPIEIQMGHFDAGIRARKRMDVLRIIATKTKTSQLVTVRWSDESNDAFNVGETLDLNTPDQRLNRLGKFRQRNIKLEYSGDQQLRIEGVETDIKRLTV